MWNHYKKSFWLIQMLIVLVTATVYQSAEHRLSVAAFFFLTMQISSVIGSIWAMRLRRKLAEHRP
jgi:hypothetical protein